MNTTNEHTNLWRNHVDKYGMKHEDFINPDYIVPLFPEDEMHVGYEPLCEDVAFSDPISLTQHIFIDHFRIRREKMTLEQVISCIRKMILYPTNNAEVYIDESRDFQYSTLLYRVTCIVREYMNDGMELDANVLVSVSADLENDSYLVEVNRYSGHRTVFYRFYKTFYSYMETGGTQSPSIRVHCGILTNPLHLVNALM